MKATRRQILLALAAGAFYATTATAVAQSASFPSRPITFVLPFPAGGTTDVVARMVAEKLQARMGQPVVVDNRPGGNSLIATNYVMGQRPDGHTLYFASSTSIEQPVLRPAVARFDPVADLTPIIYLGRVKFVLVVTPSLPVRNVAEFIQLAKSRPNGLSLANIGPGAADHLAGELIALRTGARLLAVPYKGSMAAVTDVASGVVDARITDYGSARPFIEAGKVRVIASAELTRPEGATLETIAETVPGAEVTVWFAMLGPKGMPADLVRSLNSHLAAIMLMPDIQEKVRGLYLEPAVSTPEELRKRIQARVAEVGQIMRERKLTFDN